MKVTIRPLTPVDAAISYKWRNNPEIWKYTENRPAGIISRDIEHHWLIKVLERHDEKRFAICVNDQYIGNVQLTNIDRGSAEFHIFIGEMSYHGRGIGTKATLLVLEYAFSVLNLNSVYLFVNKRNHAAIKMYKRCEFRELDEIDEVIKMEIINGTKND